MLTHTQSLRSLSLIYPDGLLEDMTAAAASSGLKKNTTLREFTLEVSLGATDVSLILTSLRDHPHLRRLSLIGHVTILAGLETLLLCDTSKITELVIHTYYDGLPSIGLTHMLQALARRSTLTKLEFGYCRLGRDETRLLGMVLRNTSSLETLVLANGALGSAELAELAPALYHNTSIKELAISGSGLNETESAEILRDILRRNKTVTTLGLHGNDFGRTTGALKCIAGGLGNNSTLLKIDLSTCCLGDDDFSMLAQTLGSRNTTLQKLMLGNNYFTSTGVGVLLETTEQNSCHITDLDLQANPLENEGASLQARSLGNNALPNLTRLSLSECFIGDDGFIALVSALEQKTSLLQLDFCWHVNLSERAFLGFAESLPEIKALQSVATR